MNDTEKRKRRYSLPDKGSIDRSFENRVRPHESDSRLTWLDSIKGIAILWVFLVHFIERFMPGSFFANPGENWQALSARIAQLMPLEISGLPGIFINLLRYLGWLGDQGVQLFLVASGFALSYAALIRSRNIRPSEFYAQRFFRIYKSWWAVHVFFMMLWIVLGMGLSVKDWRTWASFMGFRFFPQTMYFFSPAWWFVGLILQLYLVFPFVFRLLCRWSPTRFFLVFGGGAILIRTVGLLLLDTHLDWWSRGAVFLPRLPEFIFGMAFAKYLIEKPDHAVQRLKSPMGIATTIGIYILGNIASFTLPGMALAFILTGAGAFLFLFAVLSRSDRPSFGTLSWCGRHSYSIYLCHHPVIIFLVPASLALDATGKIFTLMTLSLALSIAGGLFLEYFTRKSSETYRNWIKKGSRGMAVRIASALAVSAALPFGFETAIRTLCPQEVLGWGERASLEPHDRLGYRLRPGSVTRLRWEGYDYVVQANALGFPGPLYPQEKDADTYRILITGDAFESAEGVDTNQSWPRLLERALLKEGWNVQVLNFSITGWGPNQYETAILEYAPRYSPDLIIIGFFVNEFFDVQMSAQDFIASIGFSLPKQNGLSSYTGFPHLRGLFFKKIKGRMNELLKGTPDPTGYFLGNFAALETKNLENMSEGASLVEQKFESIRKTAEEIRAKLLIVLVPAPIQVCGPEALSYFPKNVDLADTSRFDLDQPQRLARGIANRFRIGCIDLRVPLKAPDQKKCPYHPNNMHWTVQGHSIVADYLCREIKKAGLKVVRTNKTHRLFSKPALKKRK